jgi:hypothetical protein
MAPRAASWDRQPLSERAWLGLRALRLGLGLALVAAAFTEKLATPALAATVLQSHPRLDVLALMGLHVDDATYIRIVGSVEVLLGLLFVSGASPRVVALMTALPLVASVSLGWVELVGHLPFFGALLALLAFGSPVRSLAAAASDPPTDAELALTGSSGGPPSFAPT